MNLIKLERYLRVNLLGPGPRLIKKNLPGSDLAKVEKRWSSLYYNLTAGGRKENRRGVEGVEVLVVVDTPRQGDFGDIGFFKYHKEGDIHRIKLQALRGCKNNFNEGMMGRL